MTSAYVALALTHAPLLLMVIPLLGAALMLGSGLARLSWGIATLAASLTAALAVLFAVRMLSTAGQAIAVTPAPLYADGVGVFAAAVCSVVGAGAVMACGAVVSELEKRPASLGFALMLCTIAGWNAALMARDLVTMVAAVETAWLAAAGLAAMNAVTARAALNGALRMLIGGGVAAALMLFGVALIGRAVGSLELSALPLAQIRMTGLAGAGAALIAFGIAMKAGVAPLHSWSGAVLGRSGAMVMLVAGALGMLGALAVLVRFSAYAITAPSIGGGISAALGVLGAASVIIGSLQAVGARNLGRLAAYASAAQAGCILQSIALGSPAGFAAALVQLVAFAAAALALFGGAAVGRIHSLEMLDGFGQRAPLASAAITAGALGLMGAPLTLGFLGRWRLVEAGVGAGWWWTAGLVVITSLAGVFYGGRLVERMYFRRAVHAFAGETSLWRIAFAPALLAAIAATAIGLAPGALLRAAAAASAMLTGLAA